MKHKLFMSVAAVLIICGIILTGCGNRQILNTTWSFDRAIIILGDEKIEVQVESWKDYEDTNIQIKTKDGKIYLTDVKNVLMIKE